MLPAGQVRGGQELLAIIEVVRDEGFEKRLRSILDAQAVAEKVKAEAVEDKKALGAESAKIEVGRGDLAREIAAQATSKAAFEREKSEVAEAHSQEETRLKGVAEELATKRRALTDDQAQLAREQNLVADARMKLRRDLGAAEMAKAQAITAAMAAENAELRHDKAVEALRAALPE